MRIADSSTKLVVSHTAKEEYVREESLRTWIGPPPGENRPAGDVVSLSAAALADQGQATAAAEPGLDEMTSEDPRLVMIRMLVEALTGQKIKVTTFNGFEAAACTPVPDAPPADGQQAPVGWGIDYSLHESFREEETTMFTATGEVATADGRRIDFRLELAMHREFVSENVVRLRAGDAALVDPLVVNFAGSAAELADTFFSFDLDLDGQSDAVPALRPGSGYLALDRNGDGAINDGRELFGPATDNGFAELARHDRDGNGWLDDNDPVFARLAVLIRSADGRDSLASLHSLDIGALLLRPVATPFALKDGSNATLGEVRESSVFLRESGSAGTIQEIDLIA